MNSLTNKFNNDITISNLSKIINEELSHYDTINNVFDDLEVDELKKFKSILPIL